METDILNQNTVRLTWAGSIQGQGKGQGKETRNWSEIECALISRHKKSGRVVKTLNPVSQRAVLNRYSCHQCSAYTISDPYELQIVIENLEAFSFPTYTQRLLSSFWTNKSIRRSNSEEGSGTLPFPSDISINRSWDRIYSTISKQRNVHSNRTCSLIRIPWLWFRAQNSLTAIELKQMPSPGEKANYITLTSATTGLYWLLWNETAGLLIRCARARGYESDGLHCVGVRY